MIIGAIWCQEAEVNFSKMIKLLKSAGKLQIVPLKHSQVFI